MASAWNTELTYMTTQMGLNHTGQNHKDVERVCLHQLSALRGAIAASQTEYTKLLAFLQLEQPAS